MVHESGLDATKSTKTPATADPLWVLGNRRAGRGRAYRLAPQLEARFTRRGWPVRFFWPGSREELRELAAKAAAEGQRRLVVLGGDGTLLDVVNQIHIDGRGMELGLVPAGDANDVAAAIGLPRDPLAAAELLFEWNARPIDLIRVGTGEGRERVYLGVGGAGLDAAAARLAAETFSWLPGVWRYLAGALVAFSRDHRFEVRLDCDGATWCGRVSLVAVANAPAYGGGIQIAPEARLDDGWLDVALVEDLNWRRVLRALPALARRGELRGLKVRRFRGRRVRIDTVPSVAFHGDGEQLGSTPVNAEVLPGALRLVCPPLGR
jgi:diacylglycerol kinase (ATP)